MSGDHNSRGSIWHSGRQHPTLSDEISDKMAIEVIEADAQLGSR